MESQQILSAFSQFMDLCIEKNYTYPPEGWCPFPPATVAAAILSQAKWMEVTLGPELVKELFFPKILFLSRLTSEAEHASVNFSEGEPDARPAYARAYNSVQLNARKMQFLVKNAWDQTFASCQTDYIFVPQKMKDTWQTMQLETARVIIQIYCDEGADESKLMTDKSLMDAIKKQSPETYTQIAQRNIHETIARALATLANGVENGLITGITRDWILSGALLIGNMHSDASMRRSNLNEQQKLTNNRSFLGEKLFYLTYWHCAFDCYETSFGYLLDRDIKDSKIRMIFKELKKSALLLNVDDDDYFAEFAKKFENILLNTWFRVDICRLIEHGNAKNFLPFHFLIGHDNFVWRLRYSNGNISSGALIRDYLLGQVTVYYFPFELWMKSKLNTYSRETFSNRSIGRIFDLESHMLRNENDLLEWDLGKPMVIKYPHTDVKLSKVLARYYQLDLAEYIDRGNSKIETERNVARNLSEKSGFDGSKYQKYGFEPWIVFKYRSEQFIQECFGDKDY